MDEPQPSSSPRWNLITKLVVALTAVVIVGALVIRFHTIIAPVLMAFTLAYLLHPLASLLHKKLHFSWSLAVNLFYLVFILILLTLLAWGGVGLIGFASLFIVGLALAILPVRRRGRDRSARS